MEFSDDAIISKDLNGIIQSWNNGAERLYGYTAEEAIGKPVTILIPDDMKDEEPNILSRVRRGERIDHYITVRRRKDGALIDISLSVSPIKNARGEIVGASKIARDITGLRQTLEQQQLLLREMNHRIKNLFALAGSIVSLSKASAKTVDELARTVRDRLAALARAQDLTLPKIGESDEQKKEQVNLLGVIRTITSPYIEAGLDARVKIHCPNIPLSQTAVTSLALVLHEFTTNATKYGALSTPAGHVNIACVIEHGNLVIDWKEIGGPPPQAQEGIGFGSTLTDAAARQLGGTIAREWKPDGLEIQISIPRDRL